MESVNSTVVDTDQNPNDSPDKGDQLSQIEELKAQNAAILQKMEALMEAGKPKAEAKKPLSKEEFKELLDKDPRSAMDLVLEGKVNEKVGEITKTLTLEKQRDFYDEKAQKDFPLILSDKQFQNLVKEEIKFLTADGSMTKDNPKLVYLAARTVAATYAKGKQATVADDDAGDESVPQKAQKGSGGGSGEAPTTVRKVDAKHLPKNFEQFAKMFNMSDKARDIAKRNFEIDAKAEAHRKNRG